ncbi:MAG TPA: methylmalonyl Co-A mutase-associated GTPase MeaB [Planctomycetota bacterium]|jgi:LAO/AO transport system kinase|nr:methylmalonyl Co-A mutase-associated GTPase MeaB [Planctomycetota bacterium]
MPTRADITDRILAGDKGAIARLVSWAENADARFPAAVTALHGKVGKAWRVGVTGPPGAGKSTLVNALAKHEREKKKTVAILAVDPSSPFTGGALLGDRIRMEERTLDPGVYIRSMASRGSHGGLARAAVDACDVMDAAGFDEILVETVGVGQAEFDVVSAADTVLVVLCPGAGDGIQAMKSGLLEVADVLVVNKNDLPGADRLLVDLEEAVHVRAFGRGKGESQLAWIPPVVGCSASAGSGVADVANSIEAHRAHLASKGLDAVRREKRLAHVRRAVEERLEERLWGQGGLSERARTLLDSGRPPYDVVEALVASILAGSAGSPGERQGERQGETKRGAKSA